MPDYRLGRLNGKWTVSIWRGGRRSRYRLKAARRPDAEREALDLIRTKTVKKETLTVADLWELYRAEKDGRRVAKAMEYEWKAIGPHFGHLRPDHVTVDTCREYTAKRRAAKRHDGTIWTELGHLRTVFTWAFKSRLIPHAPMIERPQKPAPKDRWLTRQEIDQLVATEMTAHIKTAIVLMLTTAARVTAVLQLRWDRIDFERGEIDLRTSDIGPRKGRARVPMNERARKTLLEAKEAALTDYVIEWAGGPVASIKTGFNRAVKDAGLAGVTPHVLRHTAAVLMVESGVPIEEVAQYLGHTSPSVTFRVYGRFSPTHLRKAAAALEF